MSIDRYECEPNSLRDDPVGALVYYDDHVAEVERYRQREAHFAKALGVTDGGQYRADWESAIEKVVRERDEARAQADELARAAERMLELDMHEQNGEHVEPDEWARAWEALADVRRAALAALPKEDDA